MQTDYECTYELDIKYVLVLFQYLPSIWTDLRLYFFFYPAFTAFYELQPPHSRRFEITHNDTPQSVGLLWKSDQPVPETST